MAPSRARTPSDRRTTRRERQLQEEAVRFRGVPFDVAVAPLNQGSNRLGQSRVDDAKASYLARPRAAGQNKDGAKGENTEQPGSLAMATLKANKAPRHLVSEYVRVNPELFHAHPALHSPVKPGTPSFPMAEIGSRGNWCVLHTPELPAYQSVLEQMHSQSPLFKGTDGSGPGTNWFPYAQYLAELERDSSSNADAHNAANATFEAKSGQKKRSTTTSVAMAMRKLSPMEKVAERWARQSAATAAEVRLKQFTLHITKVSAQDVPDVDDASGSDPYAAFAVFEPAASEATKPSADETPPIRNSRNPRWDKAHLRLEIPAGSAAALSLARMQCGEALWKAAVNYLSLAEGRADAYKHPLISVRVLDKDPGEPEDDLIGEAQVALEEFAGAIEHLPLPSPNRSRQPPSQASPSRSPSRATQGRREGSCTISFRYEIVEYIPPPAGTLTVQNITVNGLEAFGSTKRHPSPKRQGLTKGTSQGGNKAKGHAKQVITQPAPPSCPYLRLLLLELPSDATPVAATTRASAIAGAGEQPWSDAALELRLPRGSPRPPLLRVELLDGAAPSDANGSPLAEAELRLSGEADDAEVKLSMHQQRFDGTRRVKMMTVRFQFTITVDDSAASASKLSGAKFTPPHAAAVKW